MQLTCIKACTVPPNVRGGKVEAGETVDVRGIYDPDERPWLKHFQPPRGWVPESDEEPDEEPDEDEGTVPDLG